MRLSLAFLLLLVSESFLFGQTVDRSPLINAGSVWQADGTRYFALRMPATRSYGPSPKAAAHAFIDQYRSALGATPQDELSWEQSTTGQDGKTYLRFGRTHQGHSVLGQQITVSADATGHVYSVSGTPLSSPYFAPATPPNSTVYPTGFTDPTLEADYPNFHQWTEDPAGLTWASPNPWDPASVYVLTTVHDVFEPAGYRAVRVYLDAKTRKLVFHHQLHCDLNRQLYHASTNNLPVWSEGDAFPGSLDAEDEELLLATEDIYNLYRYTFGRIGYDGNDGLMRGVTRRTNSCPNASAFGNTVSHCPGVVTDDIVGHEWTHNYIGEMSNLIYAWESGALNEGYADVFGETIDLLNNRGGDVGENTPRTGCGSGVRWRMGEDATGFGGAIRDMYSPECDNDPSARNSPQYWCNEGDSGGVHHNSGLVNRMYSLLVDGGTLNGITVTAIGMTKALHIFHHAHAAYMGRVTDFSAWATMLEQAASDLNGVNLTALTIGDQAPGLSGEIISMTDLAQLQNAIAAVQLSNPTPCPTNPTLAQSPPGDCSGTDELSVVFFQDWSNGTAGWSLAEVPSNPSTWDAKPWELTTVLPDGRAGTAVFGPNPAIGNCVDDLDNGSVDLTSPTISLPNEPTGFELRFDHYYSIENSWDGGVLYLSRNGGAFTHIPNAAFVYNGYDRTLQVNNDNPAAGLGAFTGSDASSTSGTWGTSVVDLLAAGALPGESIRLRWSMTHDGCNGWLGWYVQDIRVSYCGTAILPVEYLFMEATPYKDRIEISWATALEEANAGFHVERRTEEQNTIVSLGFVPAATEYNISDYEISGGKTYYYRLRQLDLDGTENISDWVSAAVPEGAFLLIYPNPADDRITVFTGSPGADISLYDTRGGRVRRCQETDNGAVLEVGTLPPGVYWLRAGDEVRRVVVR